MLFTLPYRTHSPQVFLLLVLLIILVDLLLGDPRYPFHPIRLIGHALSRLEASLFHIGLNGRMGGLLLFILLSLAALGSYWITSWLLAKLPGYLGISATFLWDLYIGWSLFALKDLMLHGERVKIALETQSLTEGRKAVALLVSRDTGTMDHAACARAAIESLSENIVDGVISPLFYLILFGLPGMILFKVISTMDSMVGYKNRRYLHFGWLGARADDLLNFLPSRLTWLTLSAAATLLPSCSGRQAFYCGWHQHGYLLSPNSGWSEAATAGALQRHLLGPTVRQGKTTQAPWIGPTHLDGKDAHLAATSTDIGRAIRLLYLTVALTLLPFFIVILSYSLSTL